jgi:hypothetical protein
VCEFLFYCFASTFAVKVLQYNFCVDFEGFFCQVASFLEAIFFLIRISSCSSGCWDFVFQVGWLLVERRKNLVWSLILE